MFYSLTPPKILSRPGLIQQNSSVAFHYLSSQETQRVLEKIYIYIAKHVLLIKIQFGDNLIHLWPPLQHTQKTFYAKVPLQYLLVTVQFSYSLSHHTFTIYKGHIIQSIFSFNFLWILSAGQSTASSLQSSEFQFRLRLPRSAVGAKAKPPQNMLITIILSYIRASMKLNHPPKHF